MNETERWNKNLERCKSLREMMNKRGALPELVIGTVVHGREAGSLCFTSYNVGAEQTVMVLRNIADILERTLKAGTCDVTEHRK